MKGSIQSPEQWIVFGEVGTSSKTIWAVLTGAVTAYVNSWDFDVPHDMDDFSRCYKLIALFPAWRSRLPEVAAVFPAWTPFVREWDNLCQLYREWVLARETYGDMRLKHPRIAESKWNTAWESSYAAINALKEEGMKLDGWIEDSPGSWHKGERGNA